MHDCPCCGEAVYSDNPLECCSCCKAAECPRVSFEEPEEYVNGDFECNIPRCPWCETRATFCTDGVWHPNCDDPKECERLIIEEVHRGR